MRAVCVSQPGDPSVLGIADVPEPIPGADEVVIDVVAAGLNRADLLQRAGKYPPPPGASDIIGLECSGYIAAVGEDVSSWQVGDACCALLAGGGYAERVAVPVGQVMPLPAGVDIVEAAAIPEVAATVWSNLIDYAQLQGGERVLVHGGGSGIGTFAIQFARALGCEVWCTVGSDEKAAATQALGAHPINYRTEDFADVLREQGVDVILDIIGADYLTRNLEVLATGGRLVVIATMGGRKAELDLAVMMRKRLRIIATTLRARPPIEKAAVCAGVTEQVWPMFAAGKIKPVISQTYNFDDVAAAHAALEEGDGVGKIVLRVRSTP